MSSPKGRVLIYGGNNALGGGCISHFKSQNWWVANIDVTYEEDKAIDGVSQTSHVSSVNKSDGTVSHQAVNNADINLMVHGVKDVQHQENELNVALKEILFALKLDAIICAAHSTVAGNLKNDAATQSEVMWQKNVWPSIISASLASTFLKDGGLLCLTGAKLALDGTPNMIAFGMAKAAIHQLIKSLAHPKSGLPKNSVCLAILPVTLDAVIEKELLPNTDVSDWTPTKYITDLLFKWSTGEGRPKNGSLVQFTTHNFMTSVSYL